MALISARIGIRGTAIPDGDGIMAGTAGGGHHGVSDGTAGGDRHGATILIPGGVLPIIPVGGLHGVPHGHGRHRVPVVHPLPGDGRPSALVRPMDRPYTMATVPDVARRQSTITATPAVIIARQPHRPHPPTLRGATA